jgi:hypothetical protein
MHTSLVENEEVAGIDMVISACFYYYKRRVAEWHGAARAKTNGGKPAYRRRGGPLAATGKQISLFFWTCKSIAFYAGLV